MRRAASTALALTVALGLTACGTRGTGSTSLPAGGSTASTTSATPASSASAVPAGRVTVAPGSGGPATVFTVHFVAPSSVAPVGQTRIGYTVSVTGGQGTGCLGTGSVQAGAATQGLVTSVALDPARLGSRWCPGTHVVRVIETGAPVCTPGTMCPQFLRVIGTVGETRFRVTG